MIFLIYMLLSPLYLFYFAYVQRTRADVKLSEFIIMFFVSITPIAKEVAVLFVISDLYGDRILLKKITK